MAYPLRALGGSFGRVAQALTTRSYASSNYPFTKPGEKAPVTPSDTTSKTPYPFTGPTEPKQVSPPTRPVGESHNTGVESQAISDLPHQPDYNVATDYRTSAYSPIPLRVMDGSEPTDVTSAAVLSGAPTELQARTVRIFKPAKTATQSGDWHGHHWQMDWDILSKGHRWENPLMGWQSSGDFMQATHLSFKSKEDAIHFAEKQGYEYYVQEPNERRRIPKAYASQFLHQPKKLKTIRTK